MSQRYTYTVQWSDDDGIYIGVDRRLADTCLGMLRYGLLRRVERGRYVVAEAEDTRRPPA